eukprot:399872_1
MPRRSPRLAKIEAEYKKNNKKRKWIRKSCVELSTEEDIYAPPSSSEEFEITNAETDTLTEELAELDAYKCPISNTESDIDSSAEPPTKKRKINASNTAKINSFDNKNINKNKPKNHWGSHKYSVVTGGGFSTKAKALQTIQFLKDRDIKYQKNMVGAFLCGGRSILKKAKTEEKRRNINDAIDIFTKWMKHYELNKDNIEDFNYLQLNIIKQYVILSDLYNSEKRKNEEDIYDGMDNIFDIDKTFLNVFEKLGGEIRGLRVTMNDDNISWDIVRHNKLLEFKKELIKYDIRCDGRMKTVDECLLYYKRGKLKGLPTRLHVQMIMYGYSPNKGLICRLAKDVKKRVKEVEKGYV